MKTLLSLDLSTTCTGWSVLDMETGLLVNYGTLKPSTKGLSKLKYPMQQLTKMIDLSVKIREVILREKPEHIVIEEIAGSKNRLGQKVLDGLHWIVLVHNQEFIPIVSFYDVGGAVGWRTHLGLRLSEADKANNKEHKKLNKNLGKGIPKLPIYDAKDLACRYVNKKYELTLDPQVNQSDADIGDSIAMASAYLQFRDRLPL